MVEKQPPVIRNVAAAERTLAILDAFLDRAGPLSLGEIEKASGLFKSVIFRYMLAFEKFGYLRKDGDGHYKLSAKVLRLAQAFEAGFDIAEYVRPALKRLADVTKESSVFYVPEGEQRLCLARVDSPQTVKVSVYPGSLLPLDASATGQVFRLYSEAEQAGAALKDGRLPTVTSGVGDKVSASLSLPIFGVGNRFVGALTVSGPVLRFDPMEPGAHAALLAEAAALCANLGATLAYGRRP